MISLLLVFWIVIGWTGIKKVKLITETRFYFWERLRGNPTKGMNWILQDQSRKLTSNFRWAAQHFDLLGSVRCVWGGAALVFHRALCLAEAVLGIWLCTPLSCLKRKKKNQPAENNSWWKVSGRQGDGWQEIPPLFLCRFLFSAFVLKYDPANSRHTCFASTFLRCIE